MPLTDTPVTASTVAASAGSASSTTSFSPPAGSLVVVVTDWLFATNTTGTTLTCKDSLGSSYTSLVQGGDPFGVVVCAVFALPYAAAPGSLTLTVTDTNTGTAGCLIEPHVITGQAAVYKGNTATGSSSSSSAAAEVGITTTVTGSLVFLTSSPLVTVQPSADGATSTGTWWFDSTGSGDAAITGRTALATGSPGPVTVGWTMSPASANGYGIVAAEIVPAAAASAPQVVAMPSRTWRGQFGRHYKDKLVLPLWQPVSYADSDTGTALDAGEGTVLPGSDATGAAADGGELVAVLPVSADTGTGADGGEQLLMYSPPATAAQLPPAWQARFRAGRKPALPQYQAFLAPAAFVTGAETAKGFDGVVTAPDTVVPVGDAVTGADAGEFILSSQVLSAFQPAQLPPSYRAAYRHRARPRQALYVPPVNQVSDGDASNRAWDDSRVFPQAAILILPAAG